MHRCIHMGNWNDVRIFYCIENRNLYIEQPNIATKIIILLPAITVLTGEIFRVLLNRLDIYFVPSNVGLYTLGSMLGGLFAAYFFEKYLRKKQQQGYAYLKPMGYMGEAELRLILRKARITGMVHFFGKLIIGATVLIMPFIIDGMGSLFCVLMYPVLWAFLGVVCLNLNSRERRRAIKEFKQQYNL